MEKIATGVVEMAGYMQLLYGLSLIHIWITVENHALGGTSSRTFYNRLWPDVIKGVRPGDWVIIELGHNALL